MEYPENFVEGTKICIAVKKDGISVYGNRQAFESLAKWMSYIANADPADLVHCDLPWHFETYDTLFEEDSNVFFLYEKSLQPIFVEELKASQSEMMLTFNIVQNDVINKLKKYKSSKILPESIE